MRSLHLALLLAVVFGLALAAHANDTSGTMYYTTYGVVGNSNVWKVDFNYSGGSFTLSNNTGITQTYGADGILFAPDGNLIVAGQASDQLHEITTGGAAVTTINAGTGGYHLALSGANSTATLFTLWNGPGSGGSTSIAATTLSSGGLAVNGTPYTVVCAAAAGCNTDVRGLVYDPANGVWYYGTAPDGGTGDFGFVTFSGTTATLHVLSTNMPAHGLSYDPFSGYVIINSAGTVAQVDAAGNLVSSFSFGGLQLDQAAEDGKGHLFVASNNGDLLFLDYSGTGLVGTPDYSQVTFLNYFLDDVAPLSGAGSVPEPGSLALLASGLLGLAGLTRRRSAR